MQTLSFSTFKTFLRKTKEAVTQKVGRLSLTYLNLRVQLRLEVPLLSKISLLVSGNVETGMTKLIRTHPLVTCHHHTCLHELKVAYISFNTRLRRASL